MSLVAEILAGLLFRGSLIAADLELWEITTGLGILGTVVFFARKLGVLYWLPVTITILLFFGGLFLFDLLMLFGV